LRSPRLVPIVAPSEDDEEALSTLKGILQVIDQTSQTPTWQFDGTTVRRAVGGAVEVSQLAQELLPGIAFTGGLQSCSN
jgi:hypothetical protein